MENKDHHCLQATDGLEFGTLPLYFSSSKGLARAGDLKATPERPEHCVHRCFICGTTLKRQFLKALLLLDSISSFQNEGWHQYSTTFTSVILNLHISSIQLVAPMMLLPLEIVQRLFLMLLESFTCSINKWQMIRRFCD